MYSELVRLIFWIYFFLSNVRLAGFGEMLVDLPLLNPGSHFLILVAKSQAPK